MAKMQIDLESVKARLLHSAASMGTAKKAEADTLKAAHDKAKARLADARGVVADESRRAAGFATPMFQGLAEMGTLWASSFNDTDSPIAQESAEGMANTFTATFTGATDKTAKGGTTSGYATTIRTGRLAERMLQLLQNRLESWQARAESVKDDNSDEARALRETCARYTVIPGPSAGPNGEWPTREDKEKNKIPYAPKFNGRPACVVNGIALPHRGACDRKSMLASLARLVLEHKESALHPDVLDAILDNGGRYKAAPDDSPQGFAARGVENLEKILLHGGAASADVAALVMAKALLERIAAEGLRESAPAETVQTDDSGDSEDSGESASESTSESASESTSEAPNEPPVTEGEPVALGTPSGKRARKARKEGGKL
jgi:hypothetical protein